MLGGESDHLLAHHPRRLESDDLLTVETEALVISVLERVLQSVHRRQRRCDVPRCRDFLVEVEGPSDREVDVVSRHDHKLIVCCVLGKASQAECVVDVAFDAHIESELAREPQALRCRLRVISGIEQIRHECEKERESARSRARGDEKAWSGGIGTTVLLQLSTIGGGDKQLTFVRSSLLSPGLSRFLQSKTPSFRPSYLGRKHIAVLRKVRTKSVAPARCDLAVDHRSHGRLIRRT